MTNPALETSLEVDTSQTTKGIDQWAKKTHKAFVGVEKDTEQLTQATERMGKTGATAWKANQKAAEQYGSSTQAVEASFGVMGDRIVEALQRVENQTKEVVENTKKVKKEGEDAGSTLKDKLGAAGKAVGVAFAAGAAAAVGAYKIAEKAVESFLAQQRTLTRAKIFRVSKNEALAFDKAMGGVLSKMDAMNKLGELKSLGFSQKESENLAKMARGLSVVGNMSRDAAVDLLKTGDASDELLLKFNTTTAQLEFMHNKRAMALGRELTQTEKSRVLMKLLGQQANRLGIQLKGIDKVSPFEKLQKEVTDLKDQAFKELGSETLKFVKRMGGVEAIIAKVKEQGRALWRGFKDLKGVIVDLRKATNLIPTKHISNFLIGWNRKVLTLSSSYLKATANQKKMTKAFGNNAEIKAYYKAIADGQNSLSAKPFFQRKNLTPTKTKVGTKGKGKVRTPSDAARDRQEELKARMGQAREQLRNFEQFLIQFVADQGGTISGVFSALTDIPERLGILASRFNKELQKTDGWSDKRIAKQMELGNLTAKEAKIGLLRNQIMRAGQSDQEEYLRNLKTATRQMRAALAVSESQAKLAEVAAAENDIKTDVLTAQNQLRTVEKALKVAVLGLERKELKAKGRLSALDRRRLANSRRMLATNRKNQKQYAAHAKTQLFLMGIMKQRALLEAKFLEPAKARIEMTRANRAATLELHDKQLELAQLQFKKVGANELELAQKKSLFGIQEKIQDLELKRLGLKIKLESPVDKKQKQLLEERVAGVDKELQLRRQILKVQKDINAQQLQQQTIGNRFRARLDEIGVSVRDFGQVWGTQLADNLNSVVEGVQSQTTYAVGALIQNFRKMDEIDVGKNLGANFAELFGGILAAASVTFGKMSIGYFAMGNIPGGIGLAGASIGAAAAAGVMSGVGSINEVKPDGSGGSSSSSAGTFTINQPDRARQETQRQNNQYVFVAPWDLGMSPQDQIRRMDRYSGNNRGRDSRSRNSRGGRR